MTGTNLKEAQELRNSIAKLHAVARKAVRDLGRRGMQITVTVMDSTGVSREKLGINPSARVLRESQASIRIMERRLAALESVTTDGGAEHLRRIRAIDWSKE